MSSPRPKPSTKLLDAMIEEATVDAYNDEEQITGLFTMLEEHLALPFQTTVLGVTATVTKIGSSTNRPARKMPMMTNVLLSEMLRLAMINP